MTHHDADQLATWLADGPHHGPVGVLDDALATARTTGQRPGWLVSATGGTIAQPGDSLLRYTMLTVAVVALLGLLVGALIVGGVLPPPNPRPPVVVDNTADPAPSGAPEPTPTASLSQGLVAYTVVEELQPGEGECTEGGRAYRCTASHIEIANQGGSDIRTLFAGDVAGGGLAWLVAGWVRAAARRRWDTHRRPVGIRAGVVQARRAVRLPVRRPGVLLSLPGWHAHRVRACISGCRELDGRRDPERRDSPGYGAGIDAHHQRLEWRTVLVEHSVRGLERHASLVAGRHPARLRSTAHVARARQQLDECRRLRRQRGRERPSTAHARGLVRLRSELER